MQANTPNECANTLPVTNESSFSWIHLQLKKRAFVFFEILKKLVYLNPIIFKNHFFRRILAPTQSAVGDMPSAWGDSRWGCPPQAIFFYFFIKINDFNVKIIKFMRISMILMIFLIEIFDQNSWNLNFDQNLNKKKIIIFGQKKFFFWHFFHLKS